MNSQTKKESYIIELFKTILPYKWSIIAITLFAILLAKYYLYFIPSTYESYAIIKVKVNHNKLPTEDVLRDTLSKTDTSGINQEMAILNTYKTNQKALQEVNFKIQYFQKKNYKKIELYKNAPIELVNVSNIDAKFINRSIVLSPKENGFSITTEKLPSSETYEYNTLITTPYFKGTVNKIHSVDRPIHIVLKGNNRYIYEGSIKRSLRITQVNKNANLIRVAFQDTIPARADDYVNALIDAYIVQSVKKKNQTNNKILTFLDEQLQTTRLKLEDSETQLEQYKSANRVDPSVKSKDTFEKLSAIDLELTELTLKEKLIQNITIFIKNNRNLDAIAPTLLEFNEQSTIKFIDSLQALQEKEDDLTLEYTDQYPELIKLRKQLRRTKNKIALNIKSLQKTLITKRVNLTNQKKIYEETLKSLPQKEKQLVSFQRDYEVNSKMYTYLLEKKSENELIKVASISDFEAIDAAYTSASPIKPKRLVILIIFTILGFIIAIFLSLLRSLFVDKIKTSKEVKLLTQLPIYGIIPLFKNPMVSSDLLKEAYHKLAANLQFSKKDNEGNIVLVSSNSKSEGKTTTIANLAGVFQQSQYKSILLDFDMHNPKLHTYFGLEHQYAGVSTYLSNRDNIGNIIFSTNYPNLDIITAGPTPPNPLELILSPKLEELFETLKKRYDYIFIDTSSYDTALETLYLMQYANTNLIVLREGLSKKSAINDLEKIIVEKNLKNMGLVLKSTPKKEKKEMKNLFLSAKETNDKLNKHTQKPIQLSI